MTYLNIHKCIFLGVYFHPFLLRDKKNVWYFIFLGRFEEYEMRGREDRKYVALEESVGMKRAHVWGIHIPPSFSIPGR